MQTNTRTPEEEIASLTTYCESLEAMLKAAEAVMLSRSETALEACKNLLGKHPEDAISPIKTATEALQWMEEIFTTIKNEAFNELTGYRIKHLAEMGAYLAQDIGNYTGCEHDDMMERLRAVGALSSMKEGA